MVLVVLIKKKVSVCCFELWIKIFFYLFYYFLFSWLSFTFNTWCSLRSTYMSFLLWIYFNNKNCFISSSSLLFSEGNEITMFVVYFWWIIFDRWFSTTFAAFHSRLSIATVLVVCRLKHDSPCWRVQRKITTTTAGIGHLMSYFTVLPPFVTLNCIPSSLLWSCVLQVFDM